VSQNEDEGENTWVSKCGQIRGNGICNLNRMSRRTSRLLPCRVEKHNERQSSCLLIKGKNVRSIPLDRQGSWKRKKQNLAVREGNMKGKTMNKKGGKNSSSSIHSPRRC